MKREQMGFRQFWDSFLGPFRKATPPALDLAWQRVLDRLHDDPLPALEVRETPRRRRSVWVLAAVAASVFAVVGVVALRNPSDPIVEIAENQAKKLTLPDGSH